MTNYVTIIELALDKWSKHELDGYAQMYSSRATVFGLGPEPLDLEGMKGFYRAVFAGFPDIQIKMQDAVTQDDRVAIRFRVVGSHHGEFMGVPASGAKVTADGMTILRFEDGKVIERWNSFDFFGLMTQIGAIPAR